MSDYGFCPYCCSAVALRERRIDGNDKCRNGHVYPSARSTVVADFATAGDVLTGMLDCLVDSESPRSRFEIERLRNKLESSTRHLASMELSH